MGSTLPLVPTVSYSEPVDSDAELLIRARHDRAAFAPIYRRYAPDIYRYCYRCLGTREDAEDATSQVFIQALAGLPGLRDDNVRPWIYRIAHNVVVDMARERRPSAPFDEAFIETHDIASPEAETLGREQQARLLAALASLSERDRQLVQLRLAGLTGQEIAEALQCSHGAVRVAHHRALERLRALLIDEGDRDVQVP
jgi:RNA polymerase sigma-70 factor (ECF subfamily)